MALSTRFVTVLLVLMIVRLGITVHKPRALAGVAQQPSVVSGAGKAESQPASASAIALSGTTPLKLPLREDLLDQQHAQISRYFLCRIAATPAERDKAWQPNFSSPGAYELSVAAHRNHLRKMLGLIQPALGTPQIQPLEPDGGLRIDDVTL